MLRTSFVAIAVCFSTPLLAGPIELVVDPAQSSADIELCLSVISTACDTDTSAVGGTITLSLDCPPAPEEITLHDFVLQMIDDVDLLLDYGSEGQFIATGSNVGLSYADPGTPMPPTGVIADLFTYTDVPAVAEGQLDYLATDFVCIGFGFAGYECEDTIDLSTIVLEPLSVEGTLTVSGSEVTVVLDMTISGPVDADNPGLGTMTIDATVVAVGTIPPACCPGDLTGDDRVTPEDVSKLVGCLSGPSGGAAGACQCADLDGDGDVDIGDVAAFQAVFEGL